MDPDKDKGDDVDPHAGTSSNGGRRTQRSRNSRFPNNNNNDNNQPPVNNYNRDNLPQQPPPPPPPPQDFRQRLPWHMHHHGNEKSCPLKPPPPQQWQFFTSYRPFGESARPYQFPPPPRFPQQFQFGTFPGRKSPRFSHRRENMVARSVNSNNINNNNNNNDIQPNGTLHNNYPDVPHGDVRPKTGAFLNGRKKSNKNKHHSHDSSKSNKNKKDTSKPNATSNSLACACVAGDVGVDSNLNSVSDSLKENLFLVEDSDGIKISKSCDESWLNEVVGEDSFVSKSDELDAQQVAEEGAVGGVPLNAGAAQEGNDLPPLLDKDLIDEGAIFDLDKIFQNHEISRKSDSRFANGLDSEDDLDFVFNYESKKCDDTVLSDAESEHFVHGREVSSAEHGTARLWDDSKNDLNCAHQNMNSFVNTSNGNRHVIHFQSAQSNGNSNNNSNIIVYNGMPDLADSDGGEDTGDFIDTDLPSHVKHILSSSDEMDNQSSGKESDDDDEEVRRGDKQCHSVMRKKENSNSDFNSNDLSTLEPHLLNSLSHLSMKTTLSTDRETNGASNQCNGGSQQTYCDLKEESLSSPAGYSSSSYAKRNSKTTGRCRCGVNFQLGDRRAHSTYPHKHAVRSNASQSTVYGAAAHNPAPTGILSSFPNHLGADCELPTSSDHYDHSSWLANNMTCSSHNAHCQQHHNHRLCSAVADHPELSASSQAMNPSSHACHSNPTNASGTSTAEKGSSCSSCFSPQSLGSTIGSACHHQHGNHSHAVNGFATSDEPGHGLADSSSCPQECYAESVKAREDTISASAAESERQLDNNRDLPKHPMGLNADSSSSSSNSSVAGGVDDPMLSFDSIGDHVDMVLLPMEEEIEPVLYGGAGGGDPGFDMDDEDEDEEDLMVPAALPRGLKHQLRSQASAPAVNTNTLAHHHYHHHHLLAGQSRSFDECRGPHIRDPISVGNRLPSKEFYDLIKTVSSTDSYMRFFDKNGQDVQRRTQKTSNDEESTSTTKKGNKQGKRPSGSRGDCLKVDRVMIWNEYEAYVVQYKQIAVSACGQTAVLNVLKALKFQCEKSMVCKVIKTNLRKEDKDIPEYLFSRTCAGTTAVELMSGIERLTEGVIGGRFFHFWPPRKVKLLQWLAYWMKRGAIPMATLNLQQGPHSVWEVPDSWHHQMVYGVSHQGLYLTNPLEIVSERSAVKQLHSDSVLLVRRQDIISRFRESTDLGQLLDHPDPRWMSMNVLGQVVNVLRECNMPSVPGYRLQVTSHVKIPASYQAGITLFMRKDQPSWNVMLSAPELPLE